MKSYLVTSGTLFGLVTAVHLWRVAVESRDLVREPWFVLITLLAAGLCIWAFRLLWRRRPMR